LTGWCKAGTFAIFLAHSTIAVVLLGCSPGGQASEGAPAESADTLICGYFPAGDGNGGVVQEPEYYLRSAMNRILRHHPEFASEIGMNSVSDCDSARRFYDAYDEHVMSRRDFDLAVPWGEIPEPRYLPAQEGQSAPAPDEEKIFNGLESALNPVVLLSYRTPAGARFWDDSGVISNLSATHLCSGTFIAKNWIITAAHCVAGLALQKDPTKSREASDWIISAEWKIRWLSGLDKDGRFTGLPLERTVRAVSIPSPNFLGVTNGKRRPDARIPASMVLNNVRVVEHDVALLFINPFPFDDVLPNIAGFPETTLFVSTAEPDIDHWTLRDYGYGARTEAEANQQGRPIVQSQAPMATPPALFKGSITLFGSGLSPGFTTASLCPGDSGGPVVRVGNRGFAVVAINSGFFPSPPAGSSKKCGSDPNDIEFWPRVDIEKDFIQETMATFNGNPKRHDPDSGGLVPVPMCTPVFDTPSSTEPDMMQCWGRACFFHCDCPAGHFCDNPVVLAVSKPHTNCAACIKPNTANEPTCDCDCVVGQCRRLPDEFPINTSDAACHPP